MSTDNQSAQEAERQAFEKWAKVFYGPIHLNRREADPDDLDGPPDLDGQEYAHHLARYYWAAWQARAALAQAPAPSGEAPDGWVLVPKEPTWEMQQAALDASRKLGPLVGRGEYVMPKPAELWCSAFIYKAMIAAAPKGASK